MDRSNVIRADGNSPLTQYIRLLIEVPENLKRCLNRDAEAVRILTAKPALSEARQRAERRFWRRQGQKRTGRVERFPRVWTRRDERLVNWDRGYVAGFRPACRAARCLAWLEPCTGTSLHDHWFRLAIEESRRDETARTLCPKLDRAKAIYGRLISAARSLANDDGGKLEFDDAQIELGNLAGELMAWTKRPAPESHSVSASKTRKQTVVEAEICTSSREGGSKGRPATINERMVGEVMKNPEAMGWNSRKWAEYLKCAKSSVVETDTWQKLESARLHAKAERMKDRRRRPKASDSRRD